MHIYDFITDTEQANIKNAAQTVFSPDRFEEVLSHYQQRFQQAFEDNPANGISLNATDKSRYLAEDLQNDQDVQKWMGELLQSFKNDLRHINKLIEDVIDCYYLFLRGRHHTAVLKMYDILERYEILDNAEEDLLGIFFRCSTIRADVDHTKEEFFYHIPFNLRHFVKNQRFSVSGMPIWYGGASLVCSYYEMRKQELKEYPDIAISVWGFDPLCFLNGRVDDKVVKPRTKVYDITNELYDAINTTFYNYINESDPEKKRNTFQNHHIFYRTSIRVALRKFVLSNLCTFRSTNPTGSFHEEYVIPQLLTEAIRLHKYDGILFPSTQFVGKDVIFSGRAHMNLYRSNLAMFTEYSDHNIYDEALNKSFGIEVILPDRINRYDEKEHTEAVLYLNRWRDFLTEYGHTRKEEQKRFLGLLDHIDKKLSVYRNLNIDGKNYLDSYVGKAELIGVIEYLKFISGRIRFAFQREFEAFEETL